MTQNLSTYLAFPGYTAEVFNHWHDVFGGELNLMTYGDTPLEGMPFEPDPQAVSHVRLDLPGGSLTGGDSMPGDPDLPIKDTAYSLLYTVDTVDHARELIAKLLAAGGTIGMPFEQAPWGGYYGQVFDKYGVMWAFDVS